MTWPFFWDSFMRQEGSPNAGGMLRWPVKLILPLGFLLLVLQGLSELIKRIAVLRGVPVKGNAFLEYKKPEQ
jgi:TRAP-type mannitol/chloroaromatic compound transport system permease small subunit